MEAQRRKGQGERERTMEVIMTSTKRGGGNEGRRESCLWEEERKAKAFVGSFNLPCRVYFTPYVITRTGRLCNYRTSMAAEKPNDADASIQYSSAIT